MLEVDKPADMDAHVGETLGEGEWLTITQEMIEKFADATGDHQWIHVDVARASTEMPGGKTIAHGYLTLSLLPMLGQSIFRIRQRSRGVNYGCNRVRFTSPVPSGSRIRARQVLKASEPVEGGRRLVIEATVEVEGQGRPALVAETISVTYD
ncbi:MAG TPA: MaoC family dehydratase [Acetobacteraceae bacterium]|jgi:acyl dehydratase|nr:MaoC family dehydratase [Acetobacteraceae bacterium]